MKLLRNSTNLKQLLSEYRVNNKTIGFVPTMGALHKGHLSLVNCSVSENDISVVSIFVNPTQFNNKEDLRNYPRNEKEDLNLLFDTGCDIVFIPEEKDMYPEEDKREFNFNGLDKVMEGKYREGHFNGVAQIVSKLFKIVKPEKAYFGKKDFQQVAIIKHLTKHYLQNLNIEIIPCEIIREADGLAMSSRNMLLNEDQRKTAANINKIMNSFCDEYKFFSIKDLKNQIKTEIDNIKGLKTEYIEIVDNVTLREVVEVIPEKTTACIAVFAGNIRLIDNYSF